MMYIFGIQKMFLKLCIMLTVCLPVSALANSYFIEKVESIINWGFWSILIGSLLGGIAATFIKTEVDDNLSCTELAKLIIGSGLGFFSCVSYLAYFPDTVVMKMALPSFVLGCLGAPIMVFLLTWASSENTWNKASKKLDERLGLEQDKEDH